MTPNKKLIKFQELFLFFKDISKKEKKKKKKKNLSTSNRLSLKKKLVFDSFENIKKIQAWNTIKQISKLRSLIFNWQTFKL